MCGQDLDPDLGDYDLDPDLGDYDLYLDTMWLGSQNNCIDRT